MKRALQNTFPVFCAYFPLGILFGYLFVSMGFPWYLAPVMSAIVYGGSVQFLCLGLIASGGSLWDIALGGLLLSLRNFFYGFAFLKRKGNSRLTHLYTLFGLVDATYSLLVADKENDGKYAFRVNWMIHLYWIIGTLIGSLVHLPSLPYMEFALPALFICLAIDQWQKKPALVAIFSAITAYFVLPAHFLAIATFLSAGLLISFPSKRKEVTA